MRRLQDALPEGVAHIDKRVVGDLERAAKLVDAGIELPPRWRGRAPVEQARAKNLWSSADTAMARLRDLVWSKEGPVSRADLADLRALRNAPDGVRPTVLDTLPTHFGTEPLDAETIRALRMATANDGVRAQVASEMLDATGELAGLLPRQDVLPQLRALRERVASFSALDMPANERGLVDDTLALIDRNIQRQTGARGGGYGRYVDFGEVGRANANAELLSRLEGARLGTPVPDAADAAGPAAADAADVVDDVADDVADQAADDMLSW
jgi:hypothetical protein